MIPSPNATFVACYYICRIDNDNVLDQFILCQRLITVVQQSIEKGKRGTCETSDRLCVARPQLSDVRIQSYDYVGEEIAAHRVKKLPIAPWLISERKFLCELPTHIHESFN